MFIILAHHRMAIKGVYGIVHRGRETSSIPACLLASSTRLQQVFSGRSLSQVTPVQSIMPTNRHDETDV